MYDQRFIFVEGEHPCIYDKVGKRKYYFNDDLCDKLNSLWMMSLRFEEYSKHSKKHLDCLEQAMEQVFEKPEPSIEKIIKVYNNLKGDDGMTNKQFIKDPMFKENTLLPTMLYTQAEEISYWKHKVGSLLWILGQFDKEKVKALMEELDGGDGV